jgi:hypothetical protein
MPGVKIGAAGLLAILAALPGSTAAVECRLRAGLYQQRKQLESDYAMQVGSDYAAHREIADKLVAKMNAIDTEYYRFLYTLADAGARGDRGSMVACSNMAKQDPIARQMAALVWYLYNGRRECASFTASLPHTKAQLTDFWNLDAIATHGEPEEPTSLPGIPLPDGLVEKYVSELFALVTSGNTAAIREYFYIYSNADGEYAEFMQDEVTLLFKDHPDLVLSKWPLFRPYGKKLGASEGVSREDYRSIAAKFRSLCESRRDASCAEILKIFH